MKFLKPTLLAFAALGHAGCASRGEPAVPGSRGESLREEITFEVRRVLSERCQESGACLAAHDTIFGTGIGVGLWLPIPPARAPLHPGGDVRRGPHGPGRQPVPTPATR